MKQIFRNLLDLFFPPLCVVCDCRLYDTEKHICVSCLSQLPKTNFHLQPDNRLEQFFAGRIPFRSIAAFAYFVQDGSIQRIVHQLKYNNNPEIGQLMGALCGDNLAHSDFLSAVDLLVPIPLHPRRQRQRGYNQSLQICKGLSARTHIPIDSTTLIRTVNNKSQTKNSRFDRWKNVENIFTITDTAQFAGKHILLVDDVITTGSTLESAAREILKCEGASVSIYAVGTAG